MLMETGRAAAAVATEAETPPVAALPDPAGSAGSARLRAELDEVLGDALRRASTRAEHIRLVRIASLVSALDGLDGLDGAHDEVGATGG